MDLDTIKAILEQSDTLAEADFSLATMCPRARSFRWGLWDGWTDRPWSVDGLFPYGTGNDAKDKEVDEYLKGFRIGRELRACPKMAILVGCQHDV